MAQAYQAAKDLVAKKCKDKSKYDDLLAEYKPAMDWFMEKSTTAKTVIAAAKRPAADKVKKVAWKKDGDLRALYSI